MRKSSTQASSDSSGKRITIGTSYTPTAPPFGLIVILKIGNIRKSATPDLRDSDKLETSIDGKFTNNLFEMPIFTDLISEKLFTSSSQYLYARLGMHLMVDPINSMTPKFGNLGFYTVDALDKGAGL